MRNAIARPLALVVATFACAFPANLAAAQETVVGYGPWTFGMSESEVTAVEAHAPYEPVRASMGGYETFAGDLGEGVASVSFVFNPRGELYLIRVWYDLGETYQDKLLAFYRTYADLTERFGPAVMDTGFPLNPGIPRDEFIALVPDRFAPTGEEFDLNDDGMPAEFQMDTRQIRFRPTTAPLGAHVVGIFAKLHPTTGYLANIFYQSIEHSQ